MLCGDLNGKERGDIFKCTGFPGGSAVKKQPVNAGDVKRCGGSTPGSGRPPGGGNGNPLQYSCLGNPMDRGAWRATIHAIARSQTRLIG